MDEHALHTIVYDDALEAWQELAAGDSPRRRRAYIRTAFAAIEALTFMLKREALRSGDANPGLYTLGERSMLLEESYAIGSRGDVVASPKFTPTPANFRFAVDMMMRATLPGFTIHVGVPGWEALKKATIIRNRLVHPKSAAEMSVSDDDLKVVQDAFFWVNDSTVQSLAQAVEILIKETGQPASPELARMQERWQSMRKARSRGA